MYEIFKDASLAQAYSWDMSSAYIEDYQRGLISFGAVMVMSLFSLFPLLEFSELNLVETVRSALLLVLVRLPQNLAVLALLVMLAVAYLLAYPYSTFVLAAIACSLFWLIACFMAWPGLEKYVFHIEKGQGSVSESYKQDN